MKLVKPSWVYHPDPHPRPNDVPRKLPIYSLAIHPDASRLATAGLDGKVRIWSTLPILSPELEANAANPRLLCTMTQHDGSVLCVRWAGHGRYLASGSDDHILLIWDLDPSGGGRVFGSTDVNVESWKPLIRLVGHSSDVVDLAWSPNDALLASVGLDSTIVIWDTRTFRMVAKIEGHQGFVKGVCWDPVGEFLATQSDDKTVKIWRTSDWGLDKTISEPFRSSPGSTFFRRLSWSPDGAFVASSNAMNKAVFTAALIERAGYKQDVSFVGHVDTIEVTAFNPRVLHPATKPSRKSVTCILALGSDDRSISIWGNKSRKPLVVVKEVFDGRIWDLSWTKDGRTLWACSADGTVVSLGFEDGEVEGFAQEGVLQTILETYPAYNAKVSTSKASAASTALGPQHLSQAPLPVASSLLPSPAVLGAGTPSPLRPGQAPPVTRLAPVPLGPGAEQDVSVARNGKKRIRPTHVGGNSSAAGLLSAQGSAAGGGAGAGVFGGLAQGEKEPEIIRIDANGNKVPPPPTTQQRQQAQQALAAKSAVPARLQPVVTLSGSTASLTPLNSDAMDVDDDDVVVETAPARLALASRGSAEATWTVDPSADSSAGAGAGASSKRKATDDGGPLAGAPPAGTRIKGKTLGEGLKRASGVERELRPAGAATSAAAGPGGGAVGGGDVLPRLGVKTVLKASSTDDNGEWAEAHNSLTGPTEIVHHTPSQVSWLDYLPSPVVALVQTALFAAFATDDGALSVYSPTGRRLVPMLVLDAPAVVVNANAKGGLSVVTSRGTLYSWNMRTRTSTLPSSAPPNVAHLLTAPGAKIHHSLLRPNGATVVLTTSGVAASWSAALGAWAVLSTRWHSTGSAFWDISGRVRSSTASSGRGIAASLEASLNELPAVIVDDDDVVVVRPEWWEPALSLGHLEARLQACVALGAAGDEYRRFLRAYAEKIAAEGYRAKGEELIRDLVGPAANQYPSLASSSTPRALSASDTATTILGVSKRDLLKDVLSLFVKSRHLVKLGMDWQELVKRVVALERERDDE